MAFGGEGSEPSASLHRHSLLSPGLGSLHTTTVSTRRLSSQSAPHIMIMMPVDQWHRQVAPGPHPQALSVPDVGR
eukprot:3146090-Rhodomonas_salina.1